MIKSRIAILILTVLVMSSCAVQEVKTEDVTIGTEKSPHRTIPTYFECSNC